MSKLLEVKLLADKEVIIETVSRMGIANTKKKILFPSCYLFEQDNKYYLCHFKEMFLVTRNNGYNNISEEDIVRRNAIAFCLKNWGLIDVEVSEIEPHNKFIFVLPYDEKDQWYINHKFNYKRVVIN